MKMIFTIIVLELCYLVDMCAMPISQPDSSEHIDNAEDIQKEDLNNFNNYKPFEKLSSLIGSFIGNSEENVLSIDDNSTNTLKRIDSRARLPILKDQDLLPKPMSTEVYLSMLEQFVTDNNQVVDLNNLIIDIKENLSRIDKIGVLINPVFKPKLFVLSLPKGFDDWHNFYKHESVFNYKEKGTDIDLPKDVISVDVSCPNVIRFARSLISGFAESKCCDPSNDIHLVNLKFCHLEWIIDHYQHYVSNIEDHNIDIDSKYDSGLTDEDIDLMMSLIVGEDRLFNINLMDLVEQDKFTNALKTILQNATGFQRILSLLIISIINFEKNIDFWQLNIEFIKGEDGSFRLQDRVYINESDDDSIDVSIFHEITHVFHHMIGMHDIRDELISNISILNSRDINLIDQYFPMLRPYIMNPILQQIEQTIDKYFDKDFHGILDSEKEKIMVLIIEPIIRNSMMAGFGNFIFPEYQIGQSLNLTTDIMTTETVARCIYLATILNETKLYPQYDFADDIITLPSNVLTSEDPIMHPVFSSVKILPTPVFSNDYLLIGADGLWDTAEEKLTMQGNILTSFDSRRYYIQDRQNEHIYLIRSRYESTPKTIAHNFRYHQEQENWSTEVVEKIFDLITLNCKSLVFDEYEDILGFYDSDCILRNLLEKEMNPSREEKYGFFGKASVSYNEPKVTTAKKDFKTYNRLRSAVDNIDQIKGLSIQNVFQEKKLIQENINIGNTLGETILFYAIQNSSVDIVEFLLNNGADIFVQSDIGENVLQQAFRKPKGFDRIADLLIQKGINLDYDMYDKLLVQILNFYDDDDIINKKMDYLFQKGFCINARDDKGNTVLHRFLQKQNCSKFLFEQLMKFNANVNSLNNKGETPLHIASKCGQRLAVVDLLLEGGADIQARSYEGLTVMHYIALGWNDFHEEFHCNYKILLQLFLKELNINSIDNKGDTPLHIMARKFEKSAQAIKYFIENGSDRDIENYDGKSPIKLAIQKKSPNKIFFQLSSNLKYKNKGDN